MSIQRVSSQPATFGGWNSVWPLIEVSHAHASVSIPRPQRAQQPGGVDDRRLDHPRARVERGVAQDRRQHRADVVALARVQPLAAPAASPAAAASG